MGITTTRSSHKKKRIKTNKRMLMDTSHTFKIYDVEKERKRKRKRKRKRILKKEKERKGKRIKEQNQSIRARREILVSTEREKRMLHGRAE